MILKRLGSKKTQSMLDAEGVHIQITGAFHAAVLLSFLKSFNRWDLTQRAARLHRDAGRLGRYSPGGRALSGPQDPCPVVLNPNETSVTPSGNPHVLSLGVPGSLICHSFRDQNKCINTDLILVTKTKAEEGVALAAILNHKGDERGLPHFPKHMGGSHLNHLDSLPRINELYN